MHLEVDDERLLDTPYDALSSGLLNKPFVKVERLGKYLLLKVDTDRSLMIHFGMSGSLAPVSAGEDWPRFSYVRFLFSDGGGLAFRCPRKLGRIKLVRDLDDLREQKKLGPDALHLDEARFFEILDARMAPVKSVLMNQSLLAGVGNWIADDALFRAGIYPASPCRQLTEEDKKRIYESVQLILNMAIDCQADYACFPDHLIFHQRSRKGVSPATGKPIAKMQVSGRSTYYCPDTQSPEGYSG